MSRMERVGIVAGEDFIGNVGSAYSLHEVTLSADGAILADADVAAATQEIENFFRKPGGACIIETITVVDGDDQNTALDLVFLDTTGSVGAENAAFAPADAVTQTCVGVVRVAVADFDDFVNARVATKKDLRLAVKAANGTRSLFIAAVVRSGTPTYTAAGLRLRILVRHF